MNTSLSLTGCVCYFPSLLFFSIILSPCEPELYIKRWLDRFSVRAEDLRTSAGSGDNDGLRSKMSLFAQLQREAALAQRDILRAVREGQNALAAGQLDGSFMNDTLDDNDNSNTVTPKHRSKPATAPESPFSTMPLTLASLRSVQQQQQQLHELQHEHLQEQLRAKERQARAELEEQHADDLRLIEQRHAAAVLGWEMQVRDLQHQLNLQEQLQAEARKSAEKASEHMQADLGWWRVFSTTANEFEIQSDKFDLFLID